MRTSVLALAAAGAVTVGAVSAAQAVTLSGSELAGLTYEPSPSGSSTGDSATYVSSGGGYIQLTTGDTQSGGTAGFNDTGVVLIPNGYDGVSLPSTLGAFITSPGTSSFNLVSGTNAVGGNVTSTPSSANGAYWDFEITNPNDGTKAIVNAFGINSTGANAVSATSGFTAVLYPATGSGTVNDYFTGWSNLSSTTLDGLALSSWDLTGVTIAVGGWYTATGAATDDISSITLPGTLTATPLPAALPLFAGGLGLMGLFARRRNRNTTHA
jgi:hypothetical protein